MENVTWRVCFQNLCNSSSISNFLSGQIFIHVAVPIVYNYVQRTAIFDKRAQASFNDSKLLPQEQVEWAVQEKADFILGETFSNGQEAKAALEAIKKYGNGMYSYKTEFLSCALNNIIVVLPTVNAILMWQDRLNLRKEFTHYEP